MAAARALPSAGTSNADSIPCPDPSVHQKDTSLQNHASTAALYATNPARSSRDTNKGDMKLSTAGAATSLKYARPQDLPSFPIVGIETQHSGLQAATLATANTKSVEWWQPSKSDPAARAALLATGQKMTSSWQPEVSAASSKAAMLAHNEKLKADALAAKPPAVEHNRPAANIVRKREPVDSKAQPPASTDDTDKRALLAATGAFSGTNRRRATSTPADPPSYPDSANSKKNALSAATMAHRMPRKEAEPIALSPTLSPASEAARVQYLGRNVPREMFSGAPPVELEVAEQRHQAALRASAISMAQDMYRIQQSHINEVSSGFEGHSQAAAVTADQGTAPSTAPNDDLKTQALQYINLQEAAQKLAAERLAKIKTNEDADFRDYYGYNKSQPRRRLSMKLSRRRSSSAGDMVDPEDQERSRRIRGQMSLFNDKLAQVDAKKRQHDRETLLAVAQRKVEAQMHDMDQKVFSETGKASPSIVQEWEAQARARATAASEVRMANHGKVHIGGGKYLDQSEIDAVAAARVKPTLKEMDEKVEEQRAKAEEKRLDLEEKKRQARIEKEREADLKAETKKAKDEEKHASKIRKAEEKATARTMKQADATKHEEEKKIKKEEERAKKEEEHAEEPPTSPIEPIPAILPTPKFEPEQPMEEPTKAATPSEPNRSGKQEHADVATADASTARSPRRLITKLHSGDDRSEPTSPEPKSQKKSIKTFLNKFKRQSKHSDAQGEADSPTNSSFIGGHALTGAQSSDPGSHNSNPPVIERAATPDKSSGVKLPGSAEPSSPISSLYSEDWENANETRRTPGEIAGGVSDDEFEESRDAFDERLAPPPKFVASEARTSSPVRETIFREEL